MKVTQLALSLYLLYLIGVVQNAKILGIFPIASPSHYILDNALMKALANRGHDITIVSAFSDKNVPKNGTWREIILSEDSDKLKQMASTMFDRANLSKFGAVAYAANMGTKFAENFLKHPQTQKLLASNEKFDVVILEQFQNEVHKYLAHHFGAPLIMLSNFGANSWVNPLVGNPDPPSFVAEVLTGSSNRMNLFTRLENTVLYVFHKIYRAFWLIPKQNELFRKYFPNAKVTLDQVMYNTSLVLLNSHVSTWEPSPLMPNMIEIGGFHIQPPKALPKDLQQFLDSAKDGAIYFSMGSNLKSKDLPVTTRNAMIKTFAKLKQKVLWKFENTDLEMPDNVRIISWAPQQDVLAHPNVKVFITHGGFGGIQETIYNGVPILVIPVFGDQQLNAQKAVNGGYGLKLELNDITEENFMSTLRELIYNKRYSKNAKQRSRIMHDRSRSAKDTATFWVEYVIRHQGAPHLRTAAMDLTWYQYIMLDVLAIIGGTIAVTLLSLYYLVRLCCCRRKSSIRDQTKVKKN